MKMFETITLANGATLSFYGHTPGLEPQFALDIEHSPPGDFREFKLYPSRSYGKSQSMMYAHALLRANWPKPLELQHVYVDELSTFGGRGSAKEAHLQAMIEHEVAQRKWHLHKRAPTTREELLCSTTLTNSKK